MHYEKGIRGSRCTMPLTLPWEDIILRLALTLVGSALIGLDRSERGRAAGLRTTILVALAACVSMLQVNALLSLSGKPGDSFVVMDLMRLPLGILSGIGFIGGGAIVRRGQLAIGVTTAATLWYVTVMGLCFGGGQLGLGAAMVLVGLFVLIILKRFERRIHENHRARLVLLIGDDGPDEEQVRLRLGAGGYRAEAFATMYLPRQNLRKLRCLVEWRAARDQNQTPAFLEDFRKQPAIRKISWSPV
jgi:putative Mg2+ transporter-C (MgtC) family protein